MSLKNLLNKLKITKESSGVGMYSLISLASMMCIFNESRPMGS